MPIQTVAREECPAHGIDADDRERGRVRGENPEVRYDPPDWIGHRALLVYLLTGYLWGRFRPLGAWGPRLLRRGRCNGGFEVGEWHPYICSHVWTWSAFNRLLGNQDQAEVRLGLSGAEHSGIVECVPD